MFAILSPLISEKSMHDASIGKFTFRVDPKADKYTIKKEVEKRFKVNVTKISTITIKGRSVRAGIKRNEIFKQPFKKAIVTLKTGQTIGLFDTGGKK
jgi:large subunit ribosomal protein L23